MNIFLTGLIDLILIPVGHEGGVYKESGFSLRIEDYAQNAIIPTANKLTNIVGMYLKQDLLNSSTNDMRVQDEILQEITQDYIVAGHEGELEAVGSYDWAL